MAAECAKTENSGSNCEINSQLSALKTHSPNNGANLSINKTLSKGGAPSLKVLKLNLKKLTEDMDSSEFDCGSSILNKNKYNGGDRQPL